MIWWPLCCRCWDWAAASGSGLQAVACHLAAAGEGISQAIGVGGRDLSGAVGGLMTLAALEVLARDPATALAVLISKPPDAAVLPSLERPPAGGRQRLAGLLARMYGDAPPKIDPDQSSQQRCGPGVATAAAETVVHTTP